jgi:hypothetical protein
VIGVGMMQRLDRPPEYTRGSDTSWVPGARRYLSPGRATHAFLCNVRSRGKWRGGRTRNHRSQESSMTLPRFIGVCGNPESGKSKLQRALLRRYDYGPVDDGWPLRSIARDLFGLTVNDVTTAAGKARVSEIAGVTYQNRYILRKIGSALESEFGPEIKLGWRPGISESAAATTSGSVSAASVRTRHPSSAPGAS